MTAPIIGTDCDITLTHPDINAGEPYGFLIAYDPTVRGNNVSVRRELFHGVISIRIFFTIILADDLKNHDGSPHSQDRQAMYEKLLEYLDKTENLSIDTLVGVFAGLGATGHTCTELHQPGVTHIALQFNNVSLYHPPIDSDTFFASVWDGDGIKWQDNSIWR